MRKILIITGCVATVALAVSCSGIRRDEGRAYMPDMAYSRAYETYAGLDTSRFTSVHNEWGSNGQKIFYNNQPVTGTIARGDMAAYTLKNDSIGYVQSAAVKNPLAAGSVDMKEAERLYLINCAICHGAALDGNGPLWKGGDGPYPAAPKNLLGDDMKAMTEGTMFHSVTYGKGQMGSYASQLSTRQRWMVIAYVKNKQSGGVTATAPDSAAATAAPATPANAGAANN